MDPITLAAIMAGAGFIKGETIDKKKEQKQAQLQAETTRWSPWTNMQGKDPERADPLGNAMKYGFTGYSLGQNNEAFQKDQALKDKSLKSYSTPNVNINTGSNLAPSFGSFDDFQSQPNPYTKGPRLWGAGY